MVRLGLTVRQTEALVRRAGQTKAAKAAPTGDPNVTALQKELSEALGLKVTLATAARGKGGRLTIAYRELEQLDSLILRLLKPPRPLRRQGRCESFANNISNLEDRPAPFIV